MVVGHRPLRIACELASTHFEIQTRLEELANRDDCCRIRTDLAPQALKAWLTKLENRHGRRRDIPKFADRTLDFDILLHDDHTGRFGELELPRSEILKYAHVLKPLADLAPDLHHPETRKTFAEHWHEFTGDRSLEQVAW